MERERERVRERERGSGTLRSALRMWRFDNAVQADADARRSNASTHTTDRCDDIAIAAGVTFFSRASANGTSKGNKKAVP